MNSLFENKALRAVTGETIRPGGFVLTDRAVAFCRLPEQSRVLDVGCGVGATVTHLRGKYRLNAYGLDSSAGLLGEGRGRNPEIPLVMATASSLPMGDERLAAVFCECVLSLTSDPPKVLGEFHRALRSHGLLVLTDLYLRSPEGSPGLSQLPVRSCLSGAVAKPQIEGLIRRSGFRILLWEDHSLLLKELAARLIFAGSSLQSLWGEMCSEPNGPCIATAVRKAKPGYYLLVAEKDDRDLALKDAPGGCVHFSLSRS